jgi:hypothetical protein
MNAAYDLLKPGGSNDQNLTVYYVVQEDDSGAAASLAYCNYWKAQYNVGPPVIADYLGFMWNFQPEKAPGTGVVVDKQTMEILFVTNGGDSSVYAYLFNAYLGQ